MISKHKYLQERQEASKWDQGAKKDKNADKEAKRQEQLARKAEAARLLAEEEADSPPKKTTTNKGGNKKKGNKPAGPGALSAGGGPDADNLTQEAAEEPHKIESFSATGIDNALDLLEVVNAKTDKASVGQQAAGIERHPEVIADVSTCARLAKTYPCLLVLTAKVQGENPFKFTGGPPRSCTCSWVSVHRSGRLGGL